jgi:hypothetical protein
MSWLALPLAVIRGPLGAEWLKVLPEQTLIFAD